MNKKKGEIIYLEDTLKKRAIEIEESQLRQYFPKRSKIHYFERTETGKYIDTREKKPTVCRAFINNFSFPKSLEELRNIISYGCFDIEDLLYSSEIEWTVPKWAAAGDLCLFMHAKYASSTISKLKTELKQNYSKYGNSSPVMMKWLEHGKALHNQYGGKIIAIARIVENSEYENIDLQEVHWKSRFYAKLGDVWHLDNPVDISEFNSFITVSRQGAITPLYGESYDKLKHLVLKKNPIAPEYFRSSTVGNMPLSRMNRENWLHIAYEYRYGFLLEAQFRSYYVDYYLKELGDQRTIFSECRCVKPGITNLSRVDNIIRFFGRFLPVEVKLSVPCETNLIGQVSKYCNDSMVYLTKDEKRCATGNLFYYNHVLVIDTKNIFLYDDRISILQDIYDLDNIRTIRDIELFRNSLANMLIGEYPALKRGQRR